MRLARVFVMKGKDLMGKPRVEPLICYSHQIQTEFFTNASFLWFWEPTVLAQFLLQELDFCSKSTVLVVVNNNFRWPQTASRPPSGRSSAAVWRLSGRGGDGRFQLRGVESYVVS